MLAQYPWLQKTYQFLVDSYHNAKAHHAYLFIYEGQIGQEHLFNLFTRFLLCKENHNREQIYPCGQCRACQAYNLNSNSDLYDLQQGDASKNISIDSVRTMIERIELEPVTSAQNVVTIYDASKLNVYSANAMLKTLEEPPSHTHFIIGLPSGYSVLPTIRSRCMVLNLDKPTDEQIEEFLTVQEIHQPNRAYLKALAPKQPALMLKMQQKEFPQKFIELNFKLHELFNTLEVANFIETFAANDIEVFTWQVEALSQIFTYIGKRFLVLGHPTQDSLELVLSYETDSSLYQTVDYLSKNLGDLDNVDKLYDLVERLQVIKTQLVHFSPQLAGENSLKGIAYKIASLIALFTYSLMNSSNPEEFYLKQLQKQD
ncbi:hypothetical protein CKF54_03205 [Psittacicella hinzii]|uniref:DNA-directed DNA polymerase n=1 Tax=Psittacicella hinzii TaxID=2028575 RepID=A0A3A1Y4P5_9GAMM|nr:hypothetical protein [Psittacicella hinzii]RIY33213.1 hypothetical protein CKF54_03205 [Psittacicella hinzii]